MKQLFISILFIINLSISIKAQDLIGIWQYNTPEIYSGYFDTYQFFNDMSFKFNTNQNNGLRRIISIGGRYSISNNEISFYVEYTIEIIGGLPQRSEILTGNDSWSIEGGEMKKLLLQTPITQVASFEIGKEENGKATIFIDKRKYYKVGSDPNNFY
jgi:hypothetical protein